jgi:hypothetical protein
MPEYRLFQLDDARHILGQSKHTARHHGVANAVIVHSTPSATTIAATSAKWLLLSSIGVAKVRLASLKDQSSNSRRERDNFLLETPVLPCDAQDPGRL